MKRILSLALAIFSLMLGLAGCDSSKHEHITGDWQYNESGHWQPYLSKKRGGIVFLNERIN